MIVFLFSNFRGFSRGRFGGLAGIECEREKGVTVRAGGYDSPSAGRRRTAPFELREYRLRTRKCDRPSFDDGLLEAHNGRLGDQFFYFFGTKPRIGKMSKQDRTHCELFWRFQIAPLRERVGQSPPVSLVCGGGTVEAVFFPENIPRD